MQHKIKGNRRKQVIGRFYLTFGRPSRLLTDLPISLKNVWDALTDFSKIQGCLFDVCFSSSHIQRFAGKLYNYLSFTPLPCTGGGLSCSLFRKSSLVSMPGMITTMGEILPLNLIFLFSSHVWENRLGLFCP